MNATQNNRRMIVAVLGSVFLATILSALRLFSGDIKSSGSAFTFPARGNKSLHHHAATLLGRQVDICDWDKIIANSQDEPDNLGSCERLYIQGNHLMCMLNDASQHRNQATGQMEYQWATQWTDPDSLEDWGWSTSLLDAGRLDFYDMDDALTELNINPWAMISIVNHHTYDVEVDGVEYPETGARYDNWISNDFRAIVAEVNWSPEHANSEREPDDRIPRDQITKLRNWSDGFGLGLAFYAQHMNQPANFMRNLQHVFRHDIINPETRKIMEMVYGVADLSHMPAWPGITYDMNHPKMAVLLTSPNARGVAWLLGQHKATLGVKVIKSITGFTCGERHNAACMHFEIGDGPVG